MQKLFIRIWLGGIVPIGSAWIFSQGNVQGHWKDITHSQQGVRGRQPADDIEVSFVTIQVLENESIKKYLHFSCPKNPFFWVKLKKVKIFYKHFWMFSKDYFKILNFSGESCIMEEIQMNSITYLRNRSKSSKLA